jgi:hypothetical protein
MLDCPSKIKTFTGVSPAAHAGGVIGGGDGGIGGRGPGGAGFAATVPTTRSREKAYFMVVPEVIM